MKSDCSGTVAGHSYCVEVNYGNPLPTSPTNPTTPTTKPTTGPSPTQEGIIKDCKTFYKAVDGDSCQKIVDSYGTFKLADFIKWNPAVGGSCNGLLASYYYCVGMPDTPTTPPPTNGPSPQQEGITKDCKAWYKVATGDSCQGIVDKYRTFTLAEFSKWNPATGSDCRSLLAGYYVCVGIPGTPTEPPTGPSPVQDGIAASCNKYHQAVIGDTCQTIANKYKTFSVADL